MLLGVGLTVCLLIWQSVGTDRLNVLLALVGALTGVAGILLPFTAPPAESRDRQAGVVPEAAGQGEKEFRAGILHHGWAILGSGGMAVACFLAVANDAQDMGDDPTAGQVIMLCGGLGVFLLFLYLAADAVNQVLRGYPRLLIGPAGVKILPEFEKKDPIEVPWEDVDSVQVVRQQWKAELTFTLKAGSATRSYYNGDERVHPLRLVAFDIDGIERSLASFAADKYIP
ncbi:hypothetical protein AB0M47_01825 [Hamadaea sp. NPDC051192]|uniref:hypothetical protein n=1 Tax=Hamadaea sp. NPDC051192 TaxID=3154940 RepID=UPI00341B2297